MTKEEYWEKYYSSDLCIYFNKDFNIWWDTKKFSWGVSLYLCIYLPDKFDIWWDTKKFNWYYSKYLSKYILHKIITWYIFDKININDITKIINNMEWNYD